MGVVTVDIANSRTVKRRKVESPNLTQATVIALDPGETTGWSLLTVDPAALSNPAKVKILGSIYDHQHGQVDSYRGDDGEQQMVDDLYALCAVWPHAAVVIEDFVIRINDRSRSFLAPVRTTAALKQLLWADGRITFKQTPNDAKNTATDSRLKDWGMYEREGGLNHARDADRHAILFARRCAQSLKLRSEAFPHLFKKGAPYA